MAYRMNFRLQSVDSHSCDFRESRAPSGATPRAESRVYRLRQSPYGHSRENELRERIPVPHDIFLKTI